MATIGGSYDVSQYWFSVVGMLSGGLANGLVGACSNTGEISCSRTGNLTLDITQLSTMNIIINDKS